MSWRLFASAAGRYVDKFTAQELANGAWAFAKQGFSDLLLFSTFVRTSWRSQRDFNAQELAQLHQWVLAHRIVGLHQPLSLSFRDRCLGAFRAQQSSPSNLQQDILAVLAEFSADVHEEFRTQEGYSIDVRVLWEGKYVAVEVDGPSHFLAGCGGRSPTGATMLKHRQLRALGWQVVVVPYFEWDGLTSAAARYQYLSSKLQSPDYGKVHGKQLSHENIQ
eukprot:gnl/TRDRNA2_/TRDRNA2_177801_c3_seq1.p1 gnl/TRDRNA2_/TRDRNA2_177801_c3~~gnl/TRDRNA2_/TRDRNA2_177801_c3_seq1.p1  ORF type:complete len:220 (+),score=31.92 gnl/TRDRNA2_/TRDRNA2_177801_c3_seq1:164-823(+)